MEEIRIGLTHISDLVIAKIVHKVVSEAAPTVSMQKGMVEGLVKRLQGHYSHRGIAVEAGHQEVVIDLKVNVKYGCKVHEVCRELQRNITKKVEYMTGLMVKTIHVAVEGVVLS